MRNSFLHALQYKYVDECSLVTDGFTRSGTHSLAMATSCICHFGHLAKGWWWGKADGSLESGALWCRLKHVGGVGGSKAFGLEVQVAENFVGTPPAKKFDERYWYLGG